MTNRNNTVRLIRNGLLSIITLSFVLFAVTGWLVGCAPLEPPITEVETVEDIQQFDIAKAERDSIVRVYRSFAYERWKNGDWETARRHFNTVLQHDLEHRENIYRTWADCFVRCEVMDSALYAYEQGIKYFPEDDYLHSSLAIAYRNRGRLEEAIVQQKEALRIKDEALTEQMTATGADVEALRADPKKLEYLMALAELYEKVEDWDRTIEAYRQLKDLQPDNEMVSRRLSEIIRLNRDPEEYLKVMKDEVEKFPDDANRRRSYASALFDQGYNEEAEKEYTIYTEMKPDDNEGWRNLSKARENLGKYRGAIAARKKVIESDPEALMDLIAIGRNYMNLKSWVEARRWAKKALSKDSGFGQAWVLMADIYFKAADEASGDHPRYNDKLVFVIAYGLYRSAANSSDIEARSDGDRGMRILKSSELVPSREERFMNRDKVKPVGDAYEWIRTDWPEVKYIDTYLKRLD